MNPVTAEEQMEAKTQDTWMSRNECYQFNRRSDDANELGQFMEAQSGFHTMYI